MKEVPINFVTNLFDEEKIVFEKDGYSRPDLPPWLVRMAWKREWRKECLP